MTRLLMLLFNRVGRGTYWRALGFARELVRRDVDVTLLAVSPHRRRGFVERPVDGVRLVETPDLFPRSGYDPWDTLQRIRWLAGRSFDLIHAFESRPVTLGPALAVRRRLNIPLVIDWCDWFGRGGSVEERANPLLRAGLRPLETFFEERFRPGADGVTVINHTLRRKALALGVSADRLLLLPNGASVDAIRPRPLQAARQRLGLPPDDLILGYTGAMFAADARLMADTLNLIHAHRPETRLLLIGYSNVDLTPHLVHPTAVGRTGTVTLAQLADYVAACDLGWLPLADSPANRGRFPMKVNDFMAAGRPLLVSDVGDLGPFVTGHGVGRAAPATPLDLAAATLALLADPAARHALGRQARQVAETQLAWPVVTARLAGFYGQIRSESGNAV